MGRHHEPPRGAASGAEDTVALRQPLPLSRDRQGMGHLTFKMSGHPPFGVQVMLNGDEWVERRAQTRTLPAVKEGNCFVGGSAFSAVDRLADALGDERAIGR